MNRVFALRVAKDDHQIFVNTVDGYPSCSYEKWLQFRAKELDEWRAEKLEVVEIDVTADDFARYCRDNGARYNYSTLRAIAAAKGTGKFK